jgi:hypothetical protein
VARRLANYIATSVEDACRLGHHAGEIYQMSKLASILTCCVALMVSFQAQAFPASSVPARMTASDVTLVKGGCGSGFHRDIDGECIANRYWDHGLPYVEPPYVRLPYLGGPAVALPYVGGPAVALPYVGGPAVALPYVGGPAVALPYGHGPVVRLPYVAPPAIALPYIGFW